MMSSYLYLILQQSNHDRYILTDILFLQVCYLSIQMLELCEERFYQRGE